METRRIVRWMMGTLALCLVLAGRSTESYAQPAPVETSGEAPGGAPEEAPAPPVTRGVVGEACSADAPCDVGLDCDEGRCHADKAGLWAVLNQELFFGNRVLNLLIFFGILIATGIAAFILAALIDRFLKKWAARTETKLDDILVKLVAKPSRQAVFVIGTYVAFQTLELGAAGRVVQRILLAALTLVAAMFVIRLSDRFFVQYAAQLAARTESKLDDQLLPILRKLTKMVVWVVALLIVIANMGYNVTSLIAGVSIFGAGIAFASKDLVANMFGSVAILADRPFEVGDAIAVAGTTGTVMEVGLRSTRIKTYDGTEVIMPNSRFIDSAVENVSRRPSRKVTLTIGVLYDTSAETLRAIPDKVRKVILDQEGSLKETVHCNFTGFGESSIDYEIVYWTELDYALHMRTRHDINVGIKETLEGDGIGFAFKTITIDPQPLLTKGADAPGPALAIARGRQGPAQE